MHVRTNRRRRCCIALVTGNSAVQFRLNPIETCHSIAEGAHKIRQAGRAANGIQEQIAGRIVTLFDRGRAQRAQCHTTVFEMFFCHRRIFQNLLCPIRHEPLQFLLFLIDALQHGRSREKFERAAHRESLVRAMFNMFAVAGVQRGHTDPAADSRLYRCNPGCRVIFHGYCICRDEG